LARKSRSKKQEEIVVVDEVSPGGLDDGLIVETDKAPAIIVDETPQVKEEKPKEPETLKIDFSKPITIAKVSIVTNSKMKSVVLREGQRAVLPIKSDMKHIPVWISKQFQLRVSLVNVNYDDNTVVVEANSLVEIKPEDDFLRVM